MLVEWEGAEFMQAKENILSADTWQGQLVGKMKYFAALHPKIKSNKFCPSIPPFGLSFQLPMLQIDHSCTYSRKLL